MHQYEKLLLFKKHHKKTNRYATGQEKIHANHTPDKELVPAQEHLVQLDAKTADKCAQEGLPDSAHKQQNDDRTLQGSLCLIRWAKFQEGDIGLLEGLVEATGHPP